MLFDSLQFIFFYIVVTVLYFSLRHKGRVWLLLIASCYFYLVFKPVYILILFATIIIDYFAALWIYRSKSKKSKLLLIISLIVNVGVLAFFKYWSFFSDNIVYILAVFGLEIQLPDFGLELPIGLSFHTFQAMSYLIEVYRKKQKPEKSFLIYTLYVMFYPQLVAGPIERPQNMLKQFHTYFKYNWENVKSGLMLMVWGMFKKVVIGDRLAQMVDYCFDNPGEHSGLTLLVGAVFYSFQIYCDFSGYSDMAIGAARTMGFSLMKNFDAPYLSKSIAEFWRRWHISLSSWFKDYVYIPLGGSRNGEMTSYRNLIVVFMISGLWHGAAWTFIVWGGVHAGLQILARIRDMYVPLKLPSSSIYSILSTFILVTLAWVFFRATGISNAIIILKKIILLDFFSGFGMPYALSEFFFCWLLISVLILKDIFIDEISTRNTPIFYLKFIFGICVVYFLGIFTGNQFIYFQF